MTDKSSTETKYLELEGDFEWAKVFEINRDLRGPDGVWADEGGRYTVDLLMDEDNYTILKNSKSMREGTKQEDGRWRVRFDRPHIHAKFPNLGGPPRVVKADGKTSWSIEDDGLIGNGSHGYVSVAVYPAKKYYGTRLNALQVVDAVEYKSTQRSPFANRSNEAEGNSSKDKSRETSDEMLDDEIPF